MNRTSVLSDRLGAEQLAKLSTIAGGTRLHVPSTIAPPVTGGSHGFARLSALVGERLATLLVLHFADSRIYVPRGKRSAQVDARKVAKLDAKGWSAPRIARQLGCSNRSIYAARSRNKRKETTCKE